MDIETTLSLDRLLCYVMLGLMILSVIRAILDKSHRTAMIGFALLYSIVACRIWADFNYIRLSINGDRFEGIVLFLLLGLASLLMVIGSFLPFAKKWIEKKKTISRRPTISRVNDPKSTPTPNGGTAK